MAPTGQVQFFDGMHACGDRICIHPASRQLGHRQRAEGDGAGPVQGAIPRSRLYPGLQRGPQGGQVYSCDNRRMLDIFNAYGGLPVVFIRWNPDAFKLAGQTARRLVKTRLADLEKQLRACLAAPPQQLLTIHRMFYDQLRRGKHAWAALLLFCTSLQYFRHGYVSH